MSGPVKSAVENFANPAPPEQGGPPDEIVRAIARDGRVRVIATRCDAVAAALMRAHKPAPTGAVALSRAATAALLMGATLKDRQQVGLQFNGDGPLGEIYALADANGRVRATVAAPQADVALTDKGVDLAKGIGFGRMTIIRKLSENAAPYTGIIPIVHGTIAQDLAEYYTTSEQLPSAIALSERFGVLPGDPEQPDAPEQYGIVAAGGLMIQMLPEADDADVDAMQEALSGLPPMSEFLGDAGTAEALIRMFDPQAEIKHRAPASFYCPCHRERYARALITLGVAELESMRAELEVVETLCHFCGSTYTFNQEEMGALILGATLDADKLAAWRSTRAAAAIEE
jgi:molecular chaperone Hsp33